MSTDNSVPKAPPKGRLFAGGAIFLVGFMSPAFVPLVAASQLPTEWKAAISALLLIGIPELFMLIAVAVMGRPGYEYLRERVAHGLRGLAPPERVGPTRYRIGLVMFVLPLLFGWATPYAGHLVPRYTEHRIVFGIIGDFVLLTSLFVLGGEFWDKMRGLFVRDATVRFETRSE